MLSRRHRLLFRLSGGDTVASMLVTRVLYGRDWYKKNRNQQEEAKI